jgi:hypothetical protein
MRKVVEAMETIVSAVKARRLQGARLAAPSDGGIVQPTLDSYSDAPDSYSRPLDETGIHVVTAGRRAERARVLGVDGSSRRFSTPYGSLALATVALTYSPLPLLDYPPLGYDYPIRCELSQPFIAAYAALGVQHEGDSHRPGANHRSPAGQLPVRSAPRAPVLQRVKEPPRSAPQLVNPIRQKPSRKGSSPPIFLSAPRRRGGVVRFIPARVDGEAVELAERAREAAKRLRAILEPWREAIKALRWSERSFWRGRAPVSLAGEAENPESGVRAWRKGHRMAVWLEPEARRRIEEGLARESICSVERYLALLSAELGVRVELAESDR